MVYCCCALVEERRTEVAMEMAVKVFMVMIVVVMMVVMIAKMLQLVRSPCHID